ncbi:hypothetical protein Dda_1554 [Drechslerella dactyloides]|uniref:Uncharacterized protein n=1 Tax=Drechslerella dactyloides TaxID=74499 RepID=A0AAD6J6C1_DREDA|nr:hypothetical protein Dda_1554 [Drechslerella dactyloides]
MSLYQDSQDDEDAFFREVSARIAADPTLCDRIIAETASRMSTDDSQASDRDINGDTHSRDEQSEIHSWTITPLFPRGIRRKNPYARDDYMKYLDISNDEYDELVTVIDATMQDQELLEFNLQGVTSDKKQAWCDAVTTCVRSLLGHSLLGKLDSQDGNIVGYLLYSLCKYRRKAARRVSRDREQRVPTHEEDSTPQPPSLPTRSNESTPYNSSFYDGRSRSQSVRTQQSYRAQHTLEASPIGQESRLSPASEDCVPRNQNVESEATPPKTGNVTEARARGGDFSFEILVALIVFLMLLVIVIILLSDRHHIKHRIICT